MFDQSHGLRFDIYERIHLPQDLPGIAELEEVELLPDIQVSQREDRAELRGQLLLTGLYRSEDDRTQRLAHSIPVEITVPLTRVSSLEEIGVEIENFDIDLLTMRSINITGVLSLRGIGGAETVPAWQREEFTVAYSPEEGEAADTQRAESQAEAIGELYENSLWTFGEGVTEEEDSAFPGIPAVEEDDDEAPILNLEEERYAEEDTESIEPAGGEPETESAPSGGANGWSHLAAGAADPDASAETAHLGPADAAETPERSEDDSPSASGVVHTSFALPLDEPDQESAEEHAEQVVSPPPEEKPDLKIALGAKKDEAGKTKEHLSFSSLLSSGRSRAESEQEETQAEKAAYAAHEQDGYADDSEWKSRFIRANHGVEAFRKVRLCIVQREETLDTIAEKYQLSSRELALYNRLSGQTVEEGQVLYIP